PVARRRLRHLVRQLAHRQPGILLLSLAHPLSSRTDIEPPRFVTGEQRMSLDLAAVRSLHEPRGSHAPAQRNAAPAEGNIDHGAYAGTGPHADEPLRAARLAR